MTLSTRPAAQSRINLVDERPASRTGGQSGRLRLRMKPAESVAADSPAAVAGGVVRPAGRRAALLLPTALLLAAYCPQGRLAQGGRSLLGLLRGLQDLQLRGRKNRRCGVHIAGTDVGRAATTGPRATETGGGGQAAQTARATKSSGQSTRAPAATVRGRPQGGHERIRLGGGALA